MIVVGLTGGIGSGKSYVAEVFRHLGMAIYNADFQARQLMEHQPELIAQVKEAFGEDMYDGTELQRQKLAALVFSNPEKLEVLNALVHPAVRNDFNAWVSQQNGSYVIREAAILYESGSHVDCDKVIAVTAPKKLRIKRVVDRDKVTVEQVEKRMKNQWPEKRKVELADYVIVNDGKEMLLPQIMSIHSELIKMKASI